MFQLRWLIVGGTFLAVNLSLHAESNDPRGGPEVWGNLGQKLYATGERMAPNGVPFEPLFAAELDFNFGILPGKKLYLFGQTDFWTQRAASRQSDSKDEGFSKREYNLDLGVAWNPFGRLELRASVFAGNNLNRGTSRERPAGFKDGTRLEARYYFESANIYDTGLLSFIALGYHPGKVFIGGDGEEFRPGFFARAYVAYEIPGWRSYLFGDLRLIGEGSDTLRLISFDGGLAARPFSSLPNLEFRVGNELTADLKASTIRNLVYGGGRVYFGGAMDTEARVGNSARQKLRGAAGPELWGTLGWKLYGTGARIAPNGVSFDPLFTLDLDLNLGLLPQKRLYIFVEDKFWGQRAAPGITNGNQGDFDFSKREFDVDIGLAWNAFGRLEIRGAAYALNNLNRGTSLERSAGSLDGARLEARYYLGYGNIYDTGRLNFISLGYYPAQSLIGGNGEKFRPGGFSRGQFSYEMPALRSSLYCDVRLIGEDTGKLRLLTLDAGFATRPFTTFPNLEFRVGDDLSADIQANTTHNLVYGAVRLVFSNR